VASPYEIEIRNLLQTPKPDQDEPDQTNENNDNYFIAYMKGQLTRQEMLHLDLAVETILKELRESSVGGNDLKRNSDYNFTVDVLHEEFNEGT